MHKDFRHRVYTIPTEHVSEVVFKVSRPDGNYGLHKIAETVFKLGLGPCGRHVLSLKAVVCEDFLRVTQKSRLPDDLEPPECPREVYRKIAEHECTARYHRPILLVAAPEFYYTGWLWWRKKHQVERPEPEHPEGLLERDEYVALKETVRDYEKAYQEWELRVEIKEFIYKITDIHGRIVTTK